MEIKTQKNSIFGCMPKALFWNFALGVLALAAGAFFGGPKMAISPETGRGAFLFLLVLYCAVTVWSIISLNEKRKFGQLQTEGAFRYVRHPMYGAIIFLLNPGMAFLLRSWPLMLAILPAYFVWARAIWKEESWLIKAFGQRYFRYQAETWAFFPNLFAINRPAFYAILGLVVFIFAFLILNLPSFYLHFVDWEKENIDVKEPLIFFELPSPGEEQKQKYEKENSITISKIGIDAPLVMAAGTSQKELNSALDQGVVVYPGSVPPGSAGNFFLTGHSSALPWNKTEYGQVFAQLDRLAPGDRVVVYFEKERFEYEILKKEVLPAEKVFLRQNKDARILTLMTCWPIGTALKRLVLEGIMIE